MSNLKTAYGICGHLSSENYREIVRTRIDELRRLRDNWDDDNIVTDQKVVDFKTLFGIQECRVAVDGSEFAKNVMKTYHPVFIIVPKVPCGDGLVVQMDIDSVAHDSWVSIPYGWFYDF